MKHQLHTPLTEPLPAPLFLNTTLMPEEALFPAHAHPWGEFVCCQNGIVQLLVKEKRYLVPPQYGIWIPPSIHHQGLNNRKVVQSSLYVDHTLCHRLPNTPQALRVSPFMRQVLDHARERTWPRTSARQVRLLSVFVDELIEAPQAGSFLPASPDPVVTQILTYLERNPYDKRTLKELIQPFHITERTLARKCKKDLRMSLTEWRNRLRVVNAIALIEHGRSVEQIASIFGYSSASAFIVMFKKLTGETPANCKGWAVGSGSEPVPYARGQEIV